MSKEELELRGFDLTVAPWQRWDEKMIELAQKTVLKDAQSNSEVYFCLALAESVGLNPFANEIYFIRRRARDGAAGGVIPYVGREGLVKKASERGAYFETDVVHANDVFEVTTIDGQRTVKHSYGQEADRGEIVGAWALLRFRQQPLATPIKPAFAYAPLSEFLPNIPQDKQRFSPWWNQRSSMIIKCAMIMAGRQRLNLSGILIDAELDRMNQPIDGTVSEAPEFDWSTLPSPFDEQLAMLIERLNELEPGSWPPARCEMAFAGRSEEELGALAGELAGSVQTAAAQAGSAAENGSE